MLIDALNRTLLLMGTVLKPACTLECRLRALTDTRVVISADAAALRTFSGQTALVTAATLMARSGHDVWIDAEETGLLAPQPPLQGSQLLAGLVDLGLDLLPDCQIRRGARNDRVDLAVLIGTPAWAGEAAQTVAMNAGVAWATLGGDPMAWAGEDSPMGGMAAGALAAAEAFKCAMRRLRSFAPSPAHFDADFAPAAPCKIVLAKDGDIYGGLVPPADLVSGGAIGNAVAFALLRMPGLQGALGVLDDDRSDLTNLNRNALLRRSNTGQLKVDDLAGHATGALKLVPRPVRFVRGEALALTVLIGVDDIASRWTAQETGPHWIGVGQRPASRSRFPNTDPTNPARVACTQLQLRRPDLYQRLRSCLSGRGCCWSRAGLIICHAARLSHRKPSSRLCGQRAGPMRAWASPPTPTARCAAK